MENRPISPFNVFLMLCLISFWGSSFVVVKLTLREGLTPISIATFRFLVAGALFLAALLLNKLRKRDYALLVNPKDLPTLVLLALTGVTVFFVLQYTGIQLADASIAAILVCLLSPILISVFSSRVFKEKLARKQKIGIGAAAAGTFAVVIGGSVSASSNSTFLLGSLILLGTPILWATYTLVGKRIMEKYSPLLVVSYINMLGGLFLIPASLMENSFYEIALLNSTEWLAIVFLAVTCSLIGYFIWFYVMNHVKAAVASSFLFGEPFVTVLFAMAFVGESLTPATLAGGFLIFVGVYLVTKK